MPNTYELQCTSCSHRKMVGILRFPFAVCEDGSRVILPHPGEVRVAVEHTGLNLSQLRALDRLGIYQTCICGDCSQTFDIVLDEKPDCPNCDTDNAIVLESASTNSPIAPCGGCDGGSLQLVHRGIA